MVRSPVVRALGWALILAFASSVARAQTKDLCLQPYERGQELRHDGHLIAARDVLRTCTRETCPGPVRVDCVRWVAELDKAVSTVVIQAKDNAWRDVLGVHVVVDGQPVVGFKDGRPFEMDPGAHDLVLTANGQSVEEHVVIREAEKDRALVVTFASSAPQGGTGPAPSPGPLTTEPQPARPRSVSSGGVPMPTLVLGGVAILGAAGFTYL